MDLCLFVENDDAFVQTMHVKKRIKYIHSFIENFLLTLSINKFNVVCDRRKTTKKNLSNGN